LVASLTKEKNILYFSAFFFEKIVPKAASELLANLAFVGIGRFSSVHL
jgi:hypothetical protein